MDFVEICKVDLGKMIIRAAKRILNSDKTCRSYSDLNFGVTFLEHSVCSHRRLLRRWAKTRPYLGYMTHVKFRDGWIYNILVIF